MLPKYFLFLGFCCKKGISRSHTGPNVTATAHSGGHITAPVLSQNTITGNVHIIHNAPGFTGNRMHSKKPQTLDISSVIVKYKKQICSEYQYVSEYNSLPGEHVLLSERFTQPLIIQRHRDKKEREEEISSSGENLQQVLSSMGNHESVHLNSLFNSDDCGISPRAVILQGNSGNGKSFTVQKIVLDWASDKLYKERFEIVLHLNCKEINRINRRHKLQSLLEILSYSCGLPSDQISQILQRSPEKVLFIIDGFDELRLTQDIHFTSPNTDLLHRASPEVILCALLKGHVLPDSLLLVTTRSTATDTLGGLLKGPQRFSEIMGFSEKGVEEYFQKFFHNEELFRKAYTFVKANESFFTICSIPVICWIICTTINERLKIGTDITSGLETTTSIYADFVSTLLEHHCQGMSQSVPTLLKSLGQLAERGMQEQQVLLDEKTVYETVSDPANNPFLCKFLSKRTIHLETMFSFMHHSFQEFFTALYYVLLDEEESQRKLAQICPLMKNTGGLFAESLRNFAGVVQFAFGLLNEDVKCTLRKRHGLVVHQNTQAYLKKWFFKELRYGSPTNTEFPFTLHCLYELHEVDFVKKAMEVWPCIHSYGSVIRRTDCWALLYCSLCCQSIKELTLSDCKFTSEKLMMILPVLHKFVDLELDVEDPSDSDLVEMMCALTRGQTLSSQRVAVSVLRGGNCSVSSLRLSISEEISSICIGNWWQKDFAEFLYSVGLSFPHSELINIDWGKLFQIIPQNNLDALMSLLCSYCNLKKMEVTIGNLTKMWAVWTLQIIQKCISLTELKVDADYFLEEGMRILQTSCTRPGAVIRFSGLICNKPFHKCTHRDGRFRDCDQMVAFSQSSQGFSRGTTRKPLFWD